MTEHDAESKVIGTNDHWTNGQHNDQRREPFRRYNCLSSLFVDCPNPGNDCNHHSSFYYRTVMPYWSRRAHPLCTSTKYILNGFYFIHFHNFSTSVFMGRMFSILRRKTAIRTDKRIQTMNEILIGMRIIKMYAWEKPFAKLIELCRRYIKEAVN